MDANPLLRELGFSDYEARAYVSLIGAGACTGYEIAKAAGMPRANVYAVLGKLVERGAVQRFDTPDGVRYDAVEPGQFVRQLDTQHRRTLAAVEDSLASLKTGGAESAVFNLSGYEALIDHARTIIDSAVSTLRIAVQPSEAEQLAVPLRDAKARGVEITTLCMEACEAECGGCQGHIHRHALAPSDGIRWLIVVGDRDQMLAGEITASHATTIVTQRHLVVELAAAYIGQSVALATVEDDLGDRFHGLLSHRARDILNALDVQQRAHGLKAESRKGDSGGI